MAFLHDVQSNSSWDHQQLLADEDHLAYYEPRHQSARSPRVKALLALPVGFVILYLSSRITITKLGYEGPDVCTSPACTEFARVIKNNLAANYYDIDPCTNFAEYVCGGFMAKNSPRPDENAVNAFTKLNYQNRAILRSILENSYPENTSYTGVNDAANRENFAKLQTAYNACMDEDSIQKAGLQPLQKLLNELPGSIMPYGHAGDLTDSLIWLRRYGVSAILRVNTGVDNKTPDTVTIFVSGGSYGLPSKEYYNRTTVVANYTSTIAEMFAIVYESNNTDPYRSLAKQIVEFEATIARAQPDPDQANDVTYYYNPQPFSEVDELVRNISMSRLIKAFVPEGYRPEKVIVRTPDYFPQLSRILENTSSEILQGYFKWHLISAWVGRLHRTYYRPLQKFRNQLSGRPENATTHRWKTCVGEVDNNLPWIESAFWAQTQFGPEERQFGERIINDIIAIYTERLDTYNWMADAVKEKAKKKVANTIKKIGYPSASPNVLDPVEVRDYYANVSVSMDSFFNNGLTFTKFSLNLTWNALLKPTDKQQWFMTAPTVNAYYKPAGNEIAFPAGIMKNPFFNLELPEYISYGSFGVAAGHELTHGFDNSGSQYDENGAYNQWWDNTTRTNFENRTQCFVGQYSKFTVPGFVDGETLKVNGQLTLGENVADAGGVSSSYASWAKRNATNPNPLLPDLPEEFTRERLFFVSYATMWCHNMRREAAVKRIYTDPHSPNQYRIIGPLANSRPFRVAFNCPVKEPTCELW